MLPSKNRSLEEQESGKEFWIRKPDWRSITEPTWLMHKGLAEALSRRAGEVRGDFLDYGCGAMPYRWLFAHCLSYIGADFQSNPNADVVYEPGGPLPLGDGSVDAVLSTQVLEHVRDPGSYLRECRRVLRPGGRLLLSTHGFYMWHGPGDWRRWTHEGLIYEVESAGFQVLDLDAICVLRAFFLQFMSYTVFSRLLSRHLTYPLGATLIALANVLGIIFPGEVLSTSAKERTNMGFCYLIIAQPS
jgi:SAM-dependent methyltransferase